MPRAAKRRPVVEVIELDEESHDISADERSERSSQSEKIERDEFQRDECRSESPQPEARRAKRRKRALLLSSAECEQREQREEQKKCKKVKAAAHKRIRNHDMETVLVCSDDEQVPKKILGSSIRALSKVFKSQLEECGTCCFNPLQKDNAIELDEDNIRAECISYVRSRDAAGSSSSSGFGVKCLPMICGGRYQFEVELTRRSSIVVGWSDATALPSNHGSQCMGFKSDGTLVGGSSSGPEAYGPEFGYAGDVIGALLDWTRRGPRLSFVLNGRPLGVAFSPSSWHDSDYAPLQPHIFQVPGPAFSVLLRGASADVPLLHPVEGFLPIHEVAEEHFCPFSSAIEHASADERIPAVARRLILGSLGLQLPLSHVAQERLARETPTLRTLEELEAKVGLDSAQSRRRTWAARRAGA